MAENFATREQVSELSAEYPVGTLLECIEMPDDPHPVPAGTIGIVKGIDDAGNILMEWDNGSSLNLIPGVDIFKKHPLKLKDIQIDFIQSVGLFYGYTKATKVPVGEYFPYKPSKHDVLTALKEKMRNTPEKYWNVSQI